MQVNEDFTESHEVPELPPQQAASKGTLGAEAFAPPQAGHGTDDESEMVRPLVLVMCNCVWLALFLSFHTCHLAPTSDMFRSWRRWPVPCLLSCLFLGRNRAGNRRSSSTTTIESSCSG